MRVHSSLIFVTSCNSCLFCSLIAKSESASVTGTEGGADDIFQKRENREEKKTERDKRHEREYKKGYFVAVCIINNFAILHFFTKHPHLDP